MSSINSQHYMWLGTQSKWRVIGVLIVSALAIWIVYNAFIFDEYGWIISLDKHERFLRTIEAIGTGTRRDVVDRLLPKTMYERISFRWAGGGDIDVIFPDQVDEETRNGISNLPKTLTSFEQTTPLKRGLIILFQNDVIEGYEWKGYKRGMLRQQIPPERRVPSSGETQKQ